MIQKLKVQMLLHNINMKELASALHISRSGLYKKFIGQNQFTYNEICIMKDLFKLNTETFMDIFFNQKVSLKTQI